MKTPLLYQAYRTLRRGWKRMTPEARHAVEAFVASQRTDHGYMNAGGREDDYYKQFGRVLEAVFSPYRLLGMDISLTVHESRHKDTIYGRFFDFLEAEMHAVRPKDVSFDCPKVMTTNAVCCLLSMQHQTGATASPEWIEWLQQRQDATGGFHATDQAPVPDLLSTAVALFTLRLVGAEARDASDFIHAHWLDNGGFAPTIFDDYSDVEYVFYGILALGAI
ncbi:MAG: hypothetical protein J5543_10415 [Bacteroidales bacterium]|nr:hypothetical protein [Bacteroidales bacterium]